MNSGNYVLERHSFSKTFSFPQYYLSVTYRDLKKRKVRWAKEKQNGRKRPRVKKWTTIPDDNPNVGLVVKINSKGFIDAVVPSEFLHGILLYEGSLLSASHHEISMHNLNLSQTDIFSSLKQFNYLHSIRKSVHGLIVASTGTDTILEISPDGKYILWDWWAVDHGYTKDFFGKIRYLNKEVDHRHLEYGTWLDTAHINAAVEFNENKLLATVFMTGELIEIDKISGKTSVIIDGLTRPHAIRVLGEDCVSLADTHIGKALYGNIKDKKFTLKNSVDIETNWLQDCQLINNYWILVDGEHSRVYFTDIKEKVLGYDQFDSNWYLYEIVLA